MYKKIIPDRLARFFINRFDKQLTKYYPEYARLKAGQKKLERALVAAKQTQKEILPKGQPDFKGFDIYARIKPYYQVGGDYFDWMKHHENRFGIAIADVSGKGLEAALVTHSIHAALDVFSRINTKEINSVIYNLNNFLEEHTSSDKFSTLIYGEIKDNVFNYCNAGHEPPIICSGGNARTINKHNMILGGLPNISYDVFSINLSRGDTLFLYSDGIIDSIGERKEATEKIIEIINLNCDQTSKEISNQVFKFLEDYKQMDDQAVLVVKRT